MPPFLFNVNPHTVYDILWAELSSGDSKEKYKFF
jgi:hypothetical protein